MDRAKVEALLNDLRGEREAAEVNFHRLHGAVVALEKVLADDDAEEAPDGGPEVQ